MRVQPARLRDALATLALHRGVLEEGRWFVTQPDEFGLTVELREQQIRLLNNLKNSCFLVARLPEARVAGFVTLTGGSLARTRHVARLELMVHAAYRGRGLGQALMTEAMAFAERSEVLRKVSLAVFEDNARAQALYARHGFEVEGRRVGEYQEADGTFRHDLIMSRLLTPTPPHDGKSSAP